MHEPPITFGPKGIVISFAGMSSCYEVLDLLMSSRWNVKGAPKSMWFVLWGWLKSAANFMAAYPLDVETFNSKQQMSIITVTGDHQKIRPLSGDPVDTVIFSSLSQIVWPLLMCLPSSTGIDCSDNSVWIWNCGQTDHQTDIFSHRYTRLVC